MSNVIDAGDEDDTEPSAPAAQATSTIEQLRPMTMLPPPLTIQPSVSSSPEVPDINVYWLRREVLTLQRAEFLANEATTRVAGLWIRLYSKRFRSPERLAEPRVRLVVRDLVNGSPRNVRGRLVLLHVVGEKREDYTCAFLPDAEPQDDPPVHSDGERSNILRLEFLDDEGQVCKTLGNTKLMPWSKSGARSSTPSP